jgi:hypothetical protein
MEFFKDESRRKCPHCRESVLNPRMDFGCAVHCSYARQCFGDLPPELIKEREEMFKDRVAVEVKRRLRTDFKRIARSARVARYAERILHHEAAEPAIVLTAAYLSVFSPFNDPQGAGDTPELNEVRDILQSLGAEDAMTQEVADIVARLQSEDGAESSNLAIVHDAVVLASLKERSKKDGIAPDQLQGILENSFRTHGGRTEAHKALFADE